MPWSKQRKKKKVIKKNNSQNNVQCSEFLTLTFPFTSKHDNSEPIETLDKQTLKTLDQKLISYHHCNIINKYNLFNLESVLHYFDACLIFKILHGLAPPPLGEFIQQKNSSGRATRAATRGDCVIQYRRSKSGQTVFSVRATNYWNCLPIELRESTSYISFKIKLRRWIKNNQNCNHQNWPTSS